MQSCQEPLTLRLKQPSHMASTRYVRLVRQSADHDDILTHSSSICQSTVLHLDNLHYGQLCIKSGRTSHLLQKTSSVLRSSHPNARRQSTGSSPLAIYRPSICYSGPCSKAITSFKSLQQVMSLDNADTPGLDNRPSSQGLHPLCDS